MLTQTTSATTTNIPATHIIESKSDKFKRLGTQRVINALAKIRLISNLSGPGYEYTPEQSDQIVLALQSAVDTVKASLNGVVKTESEFTL